MVKSLKDLSLDCLYRNFDRFTQTRIDLPTSISNLLFSRLVNHDRLTPKYLPAITYNLISPRLAIIDFYRSIQLNDNFLTHIGMACTNLRFVRLIRCLNVTDNGIAELLMNQTKLEHLELRWMQIEGHCFPRIGAMRDLKTLILKGCAYISPDLLANFICCTRNIQILNVRGLRKMNDKAMMDIFCALNVHLLSVNVSECLNVTDQTLNCLAENCPNLKRFSMMECMNVTELGLMKLMSSCPNLEHLDLSFCSRWENSMNVAVVDSLPKSVTSLSLTGIQVSCTDEQFTSILERLPHLSALHLNGFGLLSDVFLATLLARIGKNLQIFDLSGSFGKITDVGLGSIAKHCINLTSFAMALLNNVNGLQLKQMFNDKDRAKRFTTLIFTMCPMIEYEIFELVAENCVNLQKIDISGVVKVDDIILNSLADGCDNLQCLFAKAPIKITDESLCRLATKCLDLKVLCLSGNRSVTDRSILTLANHCHYLQELYLSGCMMVSEMAIRYLQDQSNGRVSVYHVVPNLAESLSVIAKNLDTGQYVRISGV